MDDSWKFINTHRSINEEKQNNEYTIPGEGFPSCFKMMEIHFPSRRRPLTDLLVVVFYPRKQSDNPAQC